MKLKNKIALVTGGTRGFGYAVAEKFIEEGASVVICGREGVQEATNNLMKKKTMDDQVILGLPIDLSVYYGAKLLVDIVIKRFGKIDILVNNAGIYGAKGSVDKADIDEWVSTIEINLISVFKMCHYTIPYMKLNNYGKIINLSGGGATSPLPNLSAYATSKAAVVRLTETIAAECKDYHIDVNAVAPGALNTRLLDEILDVGESVVGKQFYEKALKQKESGGTPLSLGAELCTFLASDESDGITGKLISAQWDKWKEFPEHKDELLNSDIYTLKRIVAKDRNKDWDVEE
jgi:NAD(P)-dependent dehydrogenase (short-subunit alcohol dehydrogenase family)